MTQSEVIYLAFDVNKSTGTSLLTSDLMSSNIWGTFDKFSAS